MAYWITDGNYHLGDPLPGRGSIKVPERPTPHHAWDGAKWVYDLAAFGAVQLQAVKARARERMENFEADPSALYAAVAAAETDIRAKTKKADVETARDAALTGIEAL